MHTGSLSGPHPEPPFPAASTAPRAFPHMRRLAVFPAAGDGGSRSPNPLLSPSALPPEGW